MRRVLILGGTGEGVALARLLQGGGAAADFTAITALAGVTLAPAEIPGDVRTGGFGGAAGLAAYLKAETIDALIDATHPFAAQMAAQAALAAEAACIPYLKIIRPMWRRDPQDQWSETPDLPAAAQAIPEMAARRVFLTVGGRSLAAFGNMLDTWFLARVAERQPDPQLLANADYIIGRGPFNVAAETALLRDNRIDLVVTKASGGFATEAKIIAARALRLPVVMINRPPAPAGPSVASAEDAVLWLAKLV